MSQKMRNVLRGILEFMIFFVLFSVSEIQSILFSTVVNNELGTYANLIQTLTCEFGESI